MSTGIEWTDEVWNPVRGCAKMSKGCEHCYAMTQAHRFSGHGQPYEGLTKIVPGKGPQWTGKVRLVPEMLDKPLRWRKPRRVFVNSMSDLFHPDVPFDFVDRVFAVMALTPQHTYQVLTKRPERMAEYLAYAECCDGINIAAVEFAMFEDMPQREWPLGNVWLGTSVEDQRAAYERIPQLLECSATVRFLSCEPLLGPVHLTGEWHDYLYEGWWTKTGHDPGCDGSCRRCPVPVQVFGKGTIDWVIVGGESGPKARPCDVAWIRGLVAQCQAAGVPAFVKQLGVAPVMRGLDGRGHPITHRYRFGDRKGGDPQEWPEDLRVREMPEVV